MMALLFESVFSLLGLMTKPVLLVKLSCQLSVRSICIVIQTCIELLRFAMYLHLVIFWKLIIWAVAVLSLPIRAVTALYKERMVEMQLYRMRGELENAIWERKELEGQLNIAIKERKMVEVMLMELEDEHDEAIVKISMLEEEVQDLKEEIRRLKEVQGKALWSYKAQDDIGTGYNIKNIDKSVASLLKSGYNNDTSREIVHEDTAEKQDTIKSGSIAYKPNYSFSTEMISVDSDFLARQREIAISRGLFSSILSLVVGIIAWEAEDPCMPLVAALFTIVFMSLISVIQLFSTIEHKPALEAVALLSLNWFILGTLTYPTLPMVGRALIPLASSLLERTS